MSTLWGREREQRLLRELVEAAGRGHGGAALLEGEPGIGKSRLLAEATTLAGRAGLRVRAGGAEAMMAGRPFGCLIEALGIRPGPGGPDRPAETPETAQTPETAEITEIAEMLAPGHRGQPELEFAVIDRIVDLVERLAADPLVLACEDLQWADQSSLRVFYRILQLVTSNPVLLLLSRRPAPSPPGLPHLLDRFDAAGGVRIALAPLSPPDARAMAAERLGAPLDDRLAGQVARAHGNPLLIEELVDGLRDTGDHDTADHDTADHDTADHDTADHDAPALPTSATEALLARLSWLDDEVLQALRAATVLGTPFRLADLATVTGRATPALLELLREPVSLGVLSAHGSAYAFRHDLIGEAIYRTMSAPERAAWHTHAGHALAAAGHEPLTVATHLRHGAQPGDPHAPRWLARAAASVRGHAPAAAAELLDSAVALASPTSPERTELRLAQLETRMEAGPLPEAVVLGEQLLSERPPGTGERVRRALAETRMWQGRFGDAAALLAPLLDAPPADSGRPATSAHLAAWHAYVQAWHDPDAADPQVDAALAQAGRADEPHALVFASLADAIRLLHRGYFAAAATQAGAAAAILVQRYDRGEVVRLVPPVICHFAARRFDEVRQLLNHPLWADRARQQSQRHATIAGMHYLCGEWDDALATADTLAALADEQGRDRDRQIVPWVRAQVALGRGQLDEAAAVLRDTEPIAEFQCLRAALAHARGRDDEARRLVTAARDDVLAPPDHRLTVRPLWPVYLPLCLAVQDRDTAEDVAAVVTELAERAGTPATTAEGLHARGLVDDDPEQLLAAVTAYQHTPLAVERAACQEAAGAALARRGHRADAAAPLRAAAESYESIDAERSLARVEALLRELGVRRGRRGPRRRPRTGWDSLTPTEAAVAELVTSGLIYREVAERLFISRRTVETHVTHIFGKLGVKSRTELAARARDRHS